jgi:hypothetical protein
MSNAEQIKKLQDQIKELRAEEQYLTAMAPEQHLAIQLHSMLCHWNHTDGCGWEYEIGRGKVHDWNGSSHAPYLIKAKKITAYCNKQGILPANVIDILGLTKE